MTLENIILAEADEFLRGRVADEVGSDDKQIITTHIVPEKFKTDVEALTAYIGAERFKSGLKIEVSLSELLNVVPRARRRSDAYLSLINYLKDEQNITLIIKSQKS